MGECDLRNGFLVELGEADHLGRLKLWLLHLIPSDAHEKFNEVHVNIPDSLGSGVLEIIDRHGELEVLQEVT